ncbi:dimethylsulfonioproprionate lyase family protein [Nocardioides sp. AX2bis]|uniref:dimethylsulfonioproprionate lyase family protein n=1 Tax=Nocardioides sp. AX2bis TaxID=2653157 RepID=UPI0012F2E35A|nr:dimethylsulfonioproprionate lyase family protein [Nocardioides sp. AX2bis]VXB67678.1 conserved hypothetical protein [Nocardioides sp. AX2bis]
MTYASQAAPGEGVVARLALADVLQDRLREAGLREQLAALDGMDARHATAPVGPTESGGLPVLAHLAEAVDLARAVLDHRADKALAVVVASVAWTQTASYRQDPPGDGFLDGYAHATFLGPTDGGPDTASTVPAAAVGLLLLSPGVVYPHHAHPADEVYLPLTEARWSHGDATPFAVEAAGIPLHHRPWQPHAMIAGVSPLLALYLWTGAVTVPAAWTRPDPHGR